MKKWSGGGVDIFPFTLIGGWMWCLGLAVVEIDGRSIRWRRERERERESNGLTST